MATFLSNRDSNGKTNEEGHYRFQTNVWDGNILSGTLVEQAASPNMTVRIGAGEFRVPYQNYAYTGWNDGYVSISVDTANTSNPRVDRIVLYVDRSMTFTSSDTNNPGAFKFKTVTGTPAAQPVKATDATTQTSVGASNPWIEIGLLYVAANVTQITTANIFDTRVFIKTKVAAGDWTPIASTVSSVVDNGNRSYDFTMANDLTQILSPGMRLRTTNTTPTPIQSTSLNGTNQYWNNTAPSNMTFTDDFVVGAWIKLTSYGNYAIFSRYNGTSGWILNFTAAGQVNLAGINGGAVNQSSITTYQSIPLNKWVHVAAQLDMSAFTNSVTTSYIMIDGVDVPCSVARSGSNPVALVQAGNLEIGSQNAGNFFPGKIAQAFVSSQKITQANIRVIKNQGITPAIASSNNIISAYAFNGSGVDVTALNTLTAQNSAAASNADSPFGGQTNGLISSTLNYGIIQKVTATTMTVQAAEGCTIPVSGGVASISYSAARVPFGFPSEVTKWTYEYTIGGQGYTFGVPALNSWTGAPSMNPKVPAGKWNLEWQGTFQQNNTSGAAAHSISDMAQNNAFSASDKLTTVVYNASGVLTALAGFHKKKPGVNLDTLTDYYFYYNSLTGGGAVTVNLRGDFGEMTFSAINAYL